MSEKITGNKQQDLTALKAYYEALRASRGEKQQVEEVKANAQQAGTKELGEKLLKPQTKELGEKLLEQPYAKVNFVSSQGVVAKEDADDLQELFAMAGVSKKRMPSKASYENIAASVAQVSKVMTDIETEDHITTLFNSPEFEVLDNIFKA